MLRKDIEELRFKAKEFHNSKDFDTRLAFCISSASTQITTLMTMKNKIMNTAKKQCAEIDSWINNCASGLKENLEKVK